LRSFGRLQLRNLSNIIHRNTVPFGHQAVKVIIQQTLFQVGEIEEYKSNITYKWKDCFKARDIDTFCKDLSLHAKMLAPAPRNHDSFFALSIIALYFGQFHSSMKDVAKEFASIALSWANDYKHQFRSCRSDNSEYIHLRAKECLMVGYALFCYFQLPFDDISNLVSLITRFYHGQLYISEALKDIQEAVAFMETRCFLEISKRIDEIIDHVCSNFQCMTDSVEHIPGEEMKISKACIIWSHIPGTDSFKGVSNSGDEYLVKLLTGKVLVNEFPPSRLPDTIRNSKNFKRIHNNGSKYSRGW
jgi:hypothetical protein